MNSLPLVDMDLQELLDALKEKGFEAKRMPVDMSSPLATTSFGGHTFAFYKTPNYLYAVKEFASEQELDGVKGRVATITCPELSVRPPRALLL